MANPIDTASTFQGIIGNIMRQKQLTQTLQDEHAKFLTDQALTSSKASMADIMNGLDLQGIGQRVDSNGNVNEPTTSTQVASQMLGPSVQQNVQNGTFTQSAGPSGGPSALPPMTATVPGGPTPVSPDRQVVTQQPFSGPAQKWALYTPQQMQTQADLADLHKRMNEAQGKGMETAAVESAKNEAQLRALRSSRQFQLDSEGGGIDIPPGFESIGLTPGMKDSEGKPIKLTRADFWAAQKELADQKLNAAKLGSEGVKLAPGESFFQPTSSAPAQATPPSAAPAAPAGAGGAAPAPAAQPQPGSGPTPPPGMTLTASGGEPKPATDFDRYLAKYLMKIGKTPQNATADDLVEAHQAYANATKDPGTLALTHALTQARLDQIESQRGGNVPEIQPGSPQFKVAQDMAYGKLTMPQFRTLYSYSRDSGQKLAIYNKASELNPNFNPANFEMGFNLAKNPKVQQQLASMDNVAQAVPDLIKYSDLATRTGVPALNGLVLKGGINIGGKTYSDFHAAQTAFADELSGALGFGGATDMSRQMGFDMTNPKLTPEQFKSSIQNVVLPFIERKRSTLLAQMGVYGQPGMNPAAQEPAAPATAAPGASAPAAGGQVQVTDPKGKVHTFPSQAQADAFKKAAGIQ